MTKMASTDRTVPFGSASPRRAIDVADPIRETLRLLRPTLRASVSMDVQVADSVPPVYANADEIAQICLNLCVNAHDANDAHGRIDIDISAVQLSAFTCASCLHDVGPREWVRIRVRDNAGGIDSETTRRMFDPFYTTKGPRGSGLGLSMVHGLVHQHGGHIRVATTPGSGSEFTVLLSPHTV